MDESSKPKESPERKKARSLATVVTVVCQVIRTFCAMWRFFDGE